MGVRWISARAAPRASGEGGARLRGVQPLDVAQVAEGLRKAFDHQPDPTGLVATFDVKLLEHHDQFYELPRKLRR